MRTLFVIIFTFLLAAMLSTASAQTGQEAPASGTEEKSELADTVLSVKETYLDELVVEARRGWVEDDKIVFVPDKHEKNLSNSAPDLLKSMQLPMVKIEGNQVTDRMGQNVTIFINGVRANDTDLSTFWPKEAIRVEYIENPDISKYGVTGTIVNFVMREYTAGGIAKLDLWQMYPLQGWYTVSSKIEYKRMTFGIRADFSMDRFDIDRSEGSESFRDFYYDGRHHDILTHQLFSKTPTKNDNLSFSANARYYTSSFQATHTVTFTWKHNPGTTSTSSDLWNPNIFNSSSSSSFSKYHNISPMVSGSYFWKISRQFGFTADWKYQFSSQDNNSHYLLDNTPQFHNSIRESTNSMNVSLTPYFVSSSGKWGTWLALTSSFDWFDLTYRGSSDTSSSQSRNDTEAKVRFWWRPVPTFNATITPGLTASYWHIADADPSHTVLPFVNVSANWSPTDRFNLSGVVRYSFYTPSAAEINNVLIRETELLWRRGNEMLKGNEMWDVFFQSYWMPINNISIFGEAGYSKSVNEPIAFYEAADREHGGIIKTMKNGKAMNSWKILLGASGSFIRNRLNVSLEPVWQLYNPDGTDIKSMNSVSVNVQASYRVGNCRFGCLYRSPRRILSEGGTSRDKFTDSFDFIFTYGNGNIYLKAEINNIFHKYSCSHSEVNSGNYSSIIDNYRIGRRISLSFSYTLPFGKKVDESIDLNQGQTGKSSISF